MSREFTDIFSPEARDKHGQSIIFSKMSDGGAVGVKCIYLAGGSLPSR